MLENRWMTFPALDALQGFRHRFTLRHPAINVVDDRAVAIQRLSAWHADHVAEMGFDRDGLRTVKQVHGNEIAVISGSAPPCATHDIPSDGIISNVPGIAIGIYVADCCAVFLADPVNGAFGIVHSGKKGTEGGITAKAVGLMQAHFGSAPGDIVVQLSPCIRPPAYEIDFAAEIRRQALKCGIQPGNLHDTGICTSSDPDRFYSYRMEKGRTGRMLAILGRPH
jgi:polyphenol oxidase